jgi:hypothetical protein
MAAATNAAQMLKPQFGEGIGMHVYGLQDLANTSVGPAAFLAGDREKKG